MKKTLLPLLIAIISLSLSVSAQDDTYKKGTNVVSAGIGIGSSLGSFTYGSQSPGISLQFEHGTWDVGPGVISLGGYVGVKSYKYAYSGYSYKWNYTVVGVRGAYHYTGLDVKNLDAYGGAMLAYNALSYSDNYSGAKASYGSTVGLIVFVGGRYYFADPLAVFVELGYGVSYLNVGLALKVYGRSALSHKVSSELSIVSKRLTTHH